MEKAARVDRQRSSLEDMPFSPFGIIPAGTSAFAAGRIRIIQAHGIVGRGDPASRKFPKSLYWDGEGFPFIHIRRPLLRNSISCMTFAP